MGPKYQNKMAVTPDNKANPTPAVGKEAPSPLLPAAQALASPIANTLGNGKRRGRPKRESQSQ